MVVTSQTRHGSIHSGHVTTRPSRDDIGHVALGKQSDVTKDRRDASRKVVQEFGLEIRLASCRKGNLYSVMLRCIFIFFKVLSWFF